MPRIITIRCDRCDAQVAEDIEVIAARGRSPALNRKDVWLCPTCSQLFRAFLAGARVGTATHEEQPA
jgi:hypothetical protein